MHQLQEYKNARIGEVASVIITQVYWLTQRKQEALDCGKHEAADGFAYAESLARRAVERLSELDDELAGPCIKPAAGHGDLFCSLGGQTIEESLQKLESFVRGGGQ